MCVKKEVKFKRESEKKNRKFNLKVQVLRQNKSWNWRAKYFDITGSKIIACKKSKAWDCLKQKQEMKWDEKRREEKRREEMWWRGYKRQVCVKSMRDKSRRD